MDAYLSHETEYPNMQTLIRRTLTALVHHCLKAENFTEVCDMLVYQLSKDVEGATGNTLQNSGYQGRLSKILDTLSIIGTVRKGEGQTPPAYRSRKSEVEASRIYS